MREREKYEIIRNKKEEEKWRIVISEYQSM